MSRKNNNPKGILLILLAMVIFSVQDSIMKYIYSFVSLYEVYLIRTLVSLTIILLFFTIFLFENISINNKWIFCSINNIKFSI